MPDEYANLAMDPFARAIAKVYPDYGMDLRNAGFCAWFDASTISE